MELYNVLSKFMSINVFHVLEFQNVTLFGNKVFEDNN